jgi:hypothetical protein
MCPRVVFQPGIHLRVPVRSVVVGHDMQSDAGECGGHLLEEPQELLMAMPG